MIINPGASPTNAKSTYTITKVNNSGESSFSQTAIGYQDCTFEINQDCTKIIVSMTSTETWIAWNSFRIAWN